MMKIIPSQVFIASIFFKYVSLKMLSMTSVPKQKSLSSFLLNGSNQPDYIKMKDKPLFDLGT